MRFRSSENRSEQEIEVKFTCDGALFSKLLVFLNNFEPHAGETKALNAVYYDTPEHRLRQAGASLRKRSDENGESIWGLKVAQPGAHSNFSRAEYEFPETQSAPINEQFHGAAAQRLATLAGGQALDAQFTVNVRRQQVVTTYRKAEIEIAMDAGRVECEGRSATFFEIELELKFGDPRALFGFALKLARQYSLTLNFKTKAERGYQLLIQQKVNWVPAAPIVAAMGAAFGEMMASAAAGALKHFAANWPALLEEENPEATHQLRVALRRFRDLTRIYHDASDMPDFKGLRNKARSISMVLGTARSLDVFLTNLKKYQTMPSIDLQAIAALRGEVERRRADAYNDICEVIRDSSTSQFILQAQIKLLEFGKFRSDKDGIKTTKELLAKRHVALLARGRGFVTLSDKKLHVLRLKAKTMRCATDIIAAASGKHSRAARFGHLLARLTRALGTHNDNVFALKLLESISDGEPSVQAGCKVLRRAIKRHDAQDLRKARKIWRAFQKSRLP